MAEAKASSELSYEAITQQIAYLMCAVANQVKPEPTKPSGCLGFKSNENNKYSSNTWSRGPSIIERPWLVGDVGELDIAGENALLPDKGIPLLSGPTSQICKPRKKAKFKWPTGGRKHNPPILSQWQPGRNPHPQENWEQQRLRLIPIIITLTPGLGYCVEQMRLMLKLMG